MIERKKTVSNLDFWIDTILFTIQGATLFILLQAINKISEDVKEDKFD